MGVAMQLSEPQNRWLNTTNGREGNMFFHKLGAKCILITFKSNFPRDHNTQLNTLAVRLGTKGLLELYLLNPQRHFGLCQRATAECFVVTSHYLSWRFVSKQGICCLSNLLITC